MPFTFQFGGFDPNAFGGGFNPGGGFSGAGDAAQRPARPPSRKPIGNALTRTLINIAVTLVFALGYFYVELPALNFHAEDVLRVRVFDLRGILRLCGADFRISGNRRQGVCRIFEKAVHHSALCLSGSGGGDCGGLACLLGGAAGIQLQ